MNPKPILFSGAATALITPFQKNAPDKIDEGAFRRLVKLQCDAGISALVTAGTTGEASALTKEEHTRLITLARDASSSSVPIIAGCGAPTTSRAVSLTLDAANAGADAILVVTPYYNKCSQEGLYRHYSAIADASPIPLILYEVPARTGLHVSLDTYKRLSVNENIIAVKDATGNLERAAQLHSALGASMHIYSGTDGVNVPLMSVGAIGCISVLSNLCPGAVVEMCNAANRGDYKTAGEMQCKYAPLIHALFSEVNPIPVKSVMASLSLCADVFRLPLCEMPCDRVADILSLIP